MHPILCQFGPLTLYSYGVMLAVAFLAGTWLMQWLMRRAAQLGAQRMLTPAQVQDLMFWVLISAVLGARVLYILANLTYYRAHPSDVFAIWHGGLIFYGGLLTAMPTMWWYLRRARWPIGQTLDCFVPTLALGQAIGRIGCFLNGCCYGKPTHAPWGVRLAWSDVPRHPTQLLETAFTLLLAVVFTRWILVHRSWTAPRQGRVAAAYVLIYATWRFLIEFLRDDNPIIALHLNLPQWVSLALLAVAGVWLIRPQRP